MTQNRAATIHSRTNCSSSHYKRYLLTYYIQYKITASQRLSVVQYSLSLPYNVLISSDLSTIHPAT